MVIKTGLLARGTYEVLGEAVAKAVGYIVLRSGVRCSNDDVGWIYLVGVD